MKAKTYSIILMTVVLLILGTPAVAGNNDIVIFSDTNLEQVIRNTLNQPTADITKTDMESITSLRATNNGIEGLTGLEYAVNLQTLNLGINEISDISPLAKLNNLQRLWLSGNQISEIRPLSNLSNLEMLYLESNQVSDISCLATLTNLQELWLSRNQISDITSLVSLANLQTVGLSSNQLIDISPLANLEKLRWVEFSGNKVSDISPMMDLTKLQRLYLSNNYLDISQGSQTINWIQSLLDKDVFVSYQTQLEKPPEVIVVTIGHLEAMVNDDIYTLDAKPFVKPEVNRTMLPVRFIGEALGVEVTWVNEEQKVILEDSDLEIVLTIDMDKALVNGREVILDCPAEILPPGRTFVPLRFVSENMGALVVYDHETREISITR